MNTTEMRTLVDRYIDAYNRMDIDAMLRTIHPEVEFRNLSGCTVNASASGIGELRTLAEQSASLFAERRQEILAFKRDGDGAVASIAFWAILAGDLPNGLKKGQEMSLTGRSEFMFRDGLIYRITDFG
jgi:hypothetical protein